MSTIYKVLLPVLFVASFVVGLVVFGFFGNDAPDPVNLETAAGNVTSSSVAGGDQAEGAVADGDGGDGEGFIGENDDAMVDGAGDGTGEGVDDGGGEGITGGGEVPTGIIGDWIVDTQTGAFDFESATGSFVGFRIEEELQGIGSTTAVGRTGDVSGGITIDGTTVTAANFSVDLTTITTNDNRRDNAVQGSLDTGQFPTAAFALSEPIQLGPGAETGEPVATSALGELTLNGVTQPVRMDLNAQLVETTVVVTGSTSISFPDFNIPVPSGGPVITVNEAGVIEMQLLLVR